MRPGLPGAERGARGRLRPCRAPRETAPVNARDGAVIRVDYTGGELAVSYENLS
jgi:hypothetical protein